MKRIFFTALLTTVAFATVPAWTQPVPRVRDVMKAKLDHSQKLLGALAVEDFDALARHSQHLALLNLDAGSRMLQTEEYARHSIDFRRHAHALRDAAQKKNIDAAALGYVQLTMTCVNCHKYVRGVRMARGDGLDEPLGLVFLAKNGDE